MEQEVRSEFYAAYDSMMRLPRTFVPFNGPEFALATLDMRLWDLVPIAHFIGSFYVEVVPLPSGRIGFRIDNDTSLESASHFRGRYPQEGYILSVEEVIERNQGLRSEPQRTVVSRYPVVSILRPLRRSETHGAEGDGLMWQTYTWSERWLDCPTDRLLAVIDPRPSLTSGIGPTSTHTHHPGLLVPTGAGSDQVHLRLSSPCVIRVVGLAGLLCSDTLN